MTCNKSARLFFFFYEIHQCPAVRARCEYVFRNKLFYLQRIRGKQSMWSIEKGKKIQIDFKRNVKLHIILSCRVIKNDISNYIVVDVIEVVVQEPKPIQKMYTKSVLDITLISHLTTRIYCYLLSTGLSGISNPIKLNIVTFVIIL